MGEGLTPGIFGFDPLGLYTFFGSTDAGKKAMQTAEIKNGRLAMLGITGFAIQEAVFRAPVIAQTPGFFKVRMSRAHTFSQHLTRLQSLLCYLAILGGGCRFYDDLASIVLNSPQSFQRGERG